MSNNSDKREKKIEAVKNKRATKDMLKRWLEEDPDLGVELVNSKIRTQEQIDAYFQKTPEEHRAIFNSGQYTVEDIKRIQKSGELSIEECTKMIADTYTKDIENGKYTIDQIKLLSDFTYNQKMAFVAVIHKKNIVGRQYSKEKIQELVENDELNEEDLRSVLSDKDIADFLPCFVEPDFLKWSDLPELELDRTDVFVFGVPGSGKSTFMSGLLYYARHNTKLTYDTHNFIGSKYLQLITDAIYDGCLVRATAEDVIQYMPCEFIDNEKKSHSLTFVEMSGEVFKKFQSADTAEIPKRMEEYMTSSNHKLLVLVIDYQQEIDGQRRSVKQNSELVTSLNILEEHHIMEKIDAILIVINKWDLSKENEDPGEFLKRRGYGDLRASCLRFADTYKIRFKFETFSLGDFYGIKNQKYNYDETDSKRIFEWFCKNSAYDNESRGITIGNGKREDGNKSGWKFW